MFLRPSSHRSIREAEYRDTLERPFIEPQNQSLQLYENAAINDVYPTLVGLRTLAE